MTNQAALLPAADPQAMTPPQQVAYYQEQSRLCATHAAHYAEQGKLHADYVVQLIAFHRLDSPSVPAQLVAVPTVSQQAPPGFHQAPVVNVGQAPREGSPTVRFDPTQPAEGPASGSFAAGTQANHGSAPFDSAPESKPDGAADSDAPKSNVKRALGASALGVLVGAVIWGGVGFITGGWEFKYGAVLIGLIVGGLALKGAGRASRSVGIAAGVMSLVSLLLGKAFFEMLVHPGFSMGEHIAYHTTIIDLIFYGATAVTGFAVAGSPGAINRVKAQLGRYIPAFR